jgi:toxin ParE1/3/4
VNVRFDEVAAEELRRAAEYYEQQRDGLGEDLKTEAMRAVELILQFPRGWPTVEAGARRIRLNRFPYGVVYFVGSDEIYIVAFMHLHRSPGDWTRRLGE